MLLKKLDYCESLIVTLRRVAF